jgi:hypothetical protein
MPGLGFSQYAQIKISNIEKKLWPKNQTQNPVDPAFARSAASSSFPPVQE